MFRRQLFIALTSALFLGTWGETAQARPTIVHVGFTQGISGVTVRMYYENSRYELDRTVTNRETHYTQWAHFSFPVQGPARYRFIYTVRGQRWDIVRWVTPNQNGRAYIQLEY